MAANYYKYSANMNDRTYFTSVVNTTSGAAKRYFSNVESEIYFGDKEMTDLYQFEFAVNEKVLPIYGYNCYYATEIVSGQRIINGQFVVNYTDSKLIQSVLSSIDDSVYNQIGTEKYVPGGSAHNAIYDKSFDIMIGYGYYDIKDKETYNATAQTIIGAKISDMNKVIDTTGQPILEVFSFIAKDFIEENITEASTGKESNEEQKDKTDKNNNKAPSFSYVCSDAYNNSEITKNDEYVKTHSDCVHLINNITYNSGTITALVNSSNYKDLTLKSGSIEITKSLSKDTTFPVFEFASISKSVGTINLEAKYTSLIDKYKKKGNNKIECTFKYKVEIASTAKEKEILEVIFEDAYIYI